MPRILIGTDDGLHELNGAGAAGEVRLAGRAVTALAAQRDSAWAVVGRTELWRTTAEEWSAAADGDVDLTCVSPTAGGLLVGSAGARLFRLAEDRLDPLPAFDGAQGRPDWYTPWGGPPDTRSISEWDDAVYVNVHVGGVLRTTDGGASWTPTIDIDADVHQVATTDDLVLAACAGGLAVSKDRGGTWAARDDGLEAPYARAVAVCADAVLVSSSNGPRGGRAALYRGSPAGGTLERCRTGLPDWFDDNIDTYCLDALPDGALAAFGTADGRIYASEDGGASWGERASGLPPVRRVLVLA